MIEVPRRAQSCVLGRESPRPFLASRRKSRLDSRHSRLDSLRHDADVGDFSYV